MAGVLSFWPSALEAAPNSGDVGAYAVKLTDEGRRVLRKLGPVVKAVDERVLVSLSEAHREPFLSSLRSVIEKLQKPPVQIRFLGSAGDPLSFLRPPSIARTLCALYGCPLSLSCPASASFAAILLNDRPRRLSRLASSTAAGPSWREAAGRRRRAAWRPW